MKPSGWSGAAACAAGASTSSRASPTLTLPVGGTRCRRPSERGLTTSLCMTCRWGGLRGRAGWGGEGQGQAGCGGGKWDKGADGSCAVLVSGNPFCQQLSSPTAQVEEGTPFARWYDQGKLSFPQEDDAAVMYAEAVAQLTAAGYEHYEVSETPSLFPLSPSLSSSFRVGGREEVPARCAVVASERI
jgi:hypothetical protein